MKNYAHYACQPIWKDVWTKGIKRWKHTGSGVNGCSETNACIYSALAKKEKKCATGIVITSRNICMN